MATVLKTRTNVRLDLENLPIGRSWAMEQRRYTGFAPCWYTILSLDGPGPRKVGSLLICLTLLFDSVPN